MPWSRDESTSLLSEWEDLYPSQPTSDAIQAAFLRELSPLSPRLVQRAYRQVYAGGSDGYRPTVGKILAACRSIAQDERLQRTADTLLLPEPQNSLSAATGKLGAEVVAAWRQRDTAR